jgi:hypothetical protein
MHGLQESWFAHQDLDNDRQQVYCGICLSAVFSMHMRCPNDEGCKEVDLGSARVCAQCASDMMVNSTIKCPSCTATMVPTSGLLQPEYNALVTSASMHGRPWQQYRQMVEDTWPRNTGGPINFDECTWIVPQNSMSVPTIDNGDYLLKIDKPLTLAKAKLALDHLGDGGTVLVQGNEHDYDINTFVKDCINAAADNGMAFEQVTPDCTLNGKGKRTKTNHTPITAMRAIRQHVSEPGAIALKGYPEECLGDNIELNIHDACPSATKAVHEMFGPLLAEIDRLDILGCALCTPSYPGWLAYLVSSCTTTQSGVYGDLDTVNHTDMSDAINANLVSLGRNPLWRVLPARFLGRLCDLQHGAAYAMGLRKTERIDQIAKRLGVPYHEFEQPQGYAVLLPVGSVHAVHHHAKSSSVKLARDFQLAQSVDSYIARNTARRNLVLQTHKGKFISKASPHHRQPYVDNSLSTNVVMGAFLHALLTTAMQPTLHRGANSPST